MPFRQPESTIIDASSVRLGGFSFRVEASLAPEQAAGKLSIDASAGYLLTSSDGKAPRQHLTLDYVVQPDGSRVAHDTLMLLRGNEPATNGSVTLRDPVGETLLMRIVSEQTAVQLRQQSILTVDPPALHFNNTDVGEDAFSIVHIGQQFAHTPVSVMVDDLANFAIATGVKQLVFGPSLLFTPAPTGTYIHVRYQPARPGRHRGNLYIETPYQIQQVRLVGRTTGFIAPTLNRQPANNPEPPQRLLPAPAEPVRQPGRLRLPVLLLLGGLAWAGYAYRCELAPSLCRQAVLNETPQPAVVEPSDERTVTAEPDRQPAETDQRPNRSIKPNTERTASERPTARPVADEPDVESAQRRTPPDEPDERPAEREPAILARSRPRPEVESPRADNRRRTTVPTELPPAVERPVRRRSNAPAPSAEESDLEQELNKKPGGNRP